MDGAGLGVQCYGLRALRLHFGVGALCPTLATAARNNIAGKIAARRNVTSWDDPAIADPCADSDVIPF